jgi:hypothetical protein
MTEDDAMRSALAVLCVVCLLPIPLVACLWDRDTLATEARGLPDVVRIITGRFERNPPLFYEMRLERIANAIERDPDDLEAYDDAGVACDRLGRGDEAIRWMEEKLARIESLEGTTKIQPSSLYDQRYRYYANVGTFWAHRWSRSGARRSKIEEIKTARDFIAKAIAINPQAHFGRETFQLQALDWIIAPPPSADKSYLPPLVDFQRTETTSDKAVRGIAGIVVLRNAWESVDIFNTLAVALKRDENRASMALLAELRCEELIDSGRRSLHPDAPSDPGSLKDMLQPGFHRQAEGAPEDIEAVVRHFRTLRNEAETWQKNRTEFMLARFKAGRHPDIDMDFWNGFHDASPPDIPDEIKLARQASRLYWRTAFEWSSVSAMGLCASWLIWTRIIRPNGQRKPAPSVEDAADIAFSASR